MTSEWNANCDKCNTLKRYSSKWDSYYCKKCNEWKENICKDIDCEYCSKRPEKPKTKAGIEPTTGKLTASSSANELLGHVKPFYIKRLVEFFHALGL